MILSIAHNAQIYATENNLLRQSHQAVMIAATTVSDRIKILADVGLIAQHPGKLSTKQCDFYLL